MIIETQNLNPARGDIKKQVQENHVISSVDV